MEYDRAEMLLEKAREESTEMSKQQLKNDVKQTTLRETLSLQLREQENIYSKLRNVRIF